jgi:Retrotransposon gag protein
LTEAFLTKYFPPSKTAQLRCQIVNFGQKGNESLYDAWERFKDLLRLCPHHGLAKQYIVQIFYDGLISNDKNFLDAAAGGALTSKNANEAYNLIETMAVNQHHWSPSDRQATWSTPGMLELDSLTFMKAKLEAIQNQISQLSVSKVNQVTHSHSCEICGAMEHTALECPLSIPQENLENVNMLNNFNRPQNNPYS